MTLRKINGWGILIQPTSFAVHVLSFQPFFKHFSTCSQWSHSAASKGINNQSLVWRVCIFWEIYSFLTVNCGLVPRKSYQKSPQLLLLIFLDFEIESWDKDSQSVQSFRQFNWFYVQILSIIGNLILRQGLNLQLIGCLCLTNLQLKFYNCISTTE